MAIPLRADSARRVFARQFADELTRAMRVRKVGRDTLGAALGMKDGASMIAHWRSGEGLPRVETAARLAGALDAPLLLEIARAGRAGTCGGPGCAKTFINEGGSPKRYCSTRCRSAAAKLREWGGSKAQRADNAERRLAEHQSAVASCCAVCEPGGLCHQPRCALRPVSPLPVTDRVNVRLATQAPGPYGTPANREKTRAAVVAGNRARWARSGERERQSQLTAEMHRDGRIPHNTRTTS